MGKLHHTNASLPPHLRRRLKRLETLPESLELGLREAAEMPRVGDADFCSIASAAFFYGLLQDLAMADNKAVDDKQLWADRRLELECGWVLTAECLISRLSQEHWPVNAVMLSQDYKTADSLTGSFNYLVERAAPETDVAKLMDISCTLGAVLKSARVGQLMLEERVRWLSCPLSEDGPVQG